MKLNRTSRMTSLPIDFSDHRPLSARWWRLAALGVLLCVSAAVMHSRLSATQAAYATAAVPEAPPAPELSDAQRARMNEALSHLGFDWPQALSHLEMALPAGVTLASAEWRGPTRELKLTGEARGTTEMLNFIDTLKRDPLLQGLKLTRQEPARDEAAAARVQFALEGRVAGGPP
ncbi:MAG: hypothetical protein RLZZ618_56 [Pseudomonadota bacterium]|jgi:hypothetical protein